MIEMNVIIRNVGKVLWSKVELCRVNILTFGALRREIQIGR
jgi:hypothetical protein